VEQSLTVCNLPPTSADPSVSIVKDCQLNGEVLKIERFDLIIKTVQHNTQQYAALYDITNILSKYKRGFTQFLFIALTLLISIQN
jgi:cadmium resistance protein CadD (predicted permease)